MIDSLIWSTNHKSWHDIWYQIFWWPFPNLWVTFFYTLLLRSIIKSTKRWRYVFKTNIQLFCHACFDNNSRIFWPLFTPGLMSWQWLTGYASFWLDIVLFSHSIVAMEFCNRLLLIFVALVVLLFWSLDLCYCDISNNVPRE